MTSEVSLSVLALCLVVFAGCATFTGTPTPTATDDPYPPGARYNDISFEGSVLADSTFRICGTLYQSEYGPERTSFEQVSLRLYRENGSLIRAWCLGDINTTKRIPLSYTTSTIPEYVIFNSPDFWTGERLVAFDVEYYYHDHDGVYYPREVQYRDWFPVNVTRHSPCQSPDAREKP